VKFKKITIPDCLWHYLLKRCFDIFLVIVILILSVLPCILIVIAIKLSSRGSIFYYSERVGKDNIIFRMPKFRSMKVGTPKVATHLLINARDHLTPIGSFLRKTSLDELPQLWSILIGDMSLVGPRPALFNQFDLISLRTQYGVDKLIPGLTGWAQINGRDDASIEEKVRLDVYYLRNISLKLDLKILFQTVYYTIRQHGITH
jgi:O-antigen biosynthesis protein WbqP